MAPSSRTVIVTGGAKGLGRDISRAFHQNGDYVLMASRHDNGFAAELGDRASFISCDVQHPHDLHAVARHALEKTGRLDVFVNNAGYSGWMPATQVGEAFWDEMIDTNLKGVFFGCQAAAKHMKN